MTAAAWIVALLAAYPHLAHRQCIVARASQIAADADSAAARFGVPVNPLYTKGFSRVGCAPCRNANKDDMRMWAQHHPERIDAVRDLEAAVTAERARRGHKGSATFFTDGSKPMPIDDVVAWSRTSRGGGAVEAAARVARQRVFPVGALRAADEGR